MAVEEWARAGAWSSVPELRFMMAWDKLKHYLASFDHFIPTLNVRVPAGSPVVAHLDLMRAFVRDDPGIGTTEWLAGRGLDFHDFFQSAIAVQRLTEVTVELQNQPRRELRERLEKVVVGPILQDFTPAPAKD